MRGVRPSPHPTSLRSATVPFAVPKISYSLFAHEILTAAHAYAPLHLPPAARGNAAPQGEGFCRTAPVILSEVPQARSRRISRILYRGDSSPAAQNDMDLVRWLSQGRMITSTPDPSSVKNQRFLPASPEGEAFGQRILRYAQNDREISLPIPTRWLHILRRDSNDKKYCKGRSSQNRW